MTISPPNFESMKFLPFLCCSMNIVQVNFRIYNWMFFHLPWCPCAAGVSHATRDQNLQRILSITQRCQIQIHHCYTHYQPSLNHDHRPPMIIEHQNHDDDWTSMNIYLPWLLTIVIMIVDHSNHDDDWPSMMNITWYRVRTGPLCLHPMTIYLGSHVTPSGENWTWYLLQFKWWRQGTSQPDLC